MMLQENGANTSALLGRLLSRLSDAAQDPSRFVAAMAAATAGTFSRVLCVPSRAPCMSPLSLLCFDVLQKESVYSCSFLRNSLSLNCCFILFLSCLLLAFPRPYPPLFFRPRGGQRCAPWPLHRRPSWRHAL